MAAQQADGPELWLHRCHDELQAVPSDVVPGAHDPLGLRCHLDATALWAETAEGLVPIVQDFFMAEITCQAFKSDPQQELALVLLVPCNADRGWFIVLQGLKEGHDLMELLGLRGCLRGDLSESYSLLEEQLGEGEYASVQRARARDGSPAAVKHIYPTRDFESIAREVSTLLECQGSNVIRLRGIFWRREQEQVRYALASELADTDLLLKVFQMGGMSEAAARPILSGILNGLRRIHEHGIVHRDVKTENVLLKGEVPLVADFGLACKSSDAVQMARRCGSAGFVAPEVCLGERYDYKVDTFGAGVILFFMLSKELPFNSPEQDSEKTMRRTVKCSLHLQRPPFNEMSSRVRNMLRQLICKDAKERLSAEQALEQSWSKQKASEKSGPKMAEASRSGPLEVSEHAPGGYAAGEVSPAAPWA